MSVCLSVGAEQPPSCICRARSSLWRMRASVLTAVGAGGRAGSKGLPPRPGQLGFSQPSDSDPLSSQAARQAGK